MPEFRKDPIIGRWVIVAQSRAQRPHEFETSPRIATDHCCPFCAGNEDSTPAEVLAYRQPGTQPNREGWRVRVVPNKYPALEIEGDLNARGEGIYEMMRGVGAHEVIIESPAHLLSTADLTAENLREVFRAYRDRLLDLKRDKRLVYGLIFKNVGEAAGASIEHTHSQLIATPLVPIAVAEELASSHELYNQRGRCVFCDMIQQELTARARIVLDTPAFVAFCPFASCFPYETWVLPKHHASHYESIQDGGLEDLAPVMQQVVGKIETALDRPAYNYIIHTGPFDSSDIAHYHWHIEIIPRLTKVAGFEWGAGFYINPVPPEDAAAELRDVLFAARSPTSVSVREIVDPKE